MTTTQTITPNLTKCLLTAHRVGCDADQMTRFIEAGYVPLPRGLEFHAAAREADTIDDQTMIGYGGSRGEAKSHAVIAQVGLDDCQRLPEAKWLYLRRIKGSAGEQLEDLISKVFAHIPHEFTQSKHRVSFPNGSSIRIGGYRDRNQLYSLIGIQYDGIIVEDATTLDKDAIDHIRGSARSSKPGWQPRLYLPSNPGGVGHAWYKEMIYDPWEQGRETNTRFIHARPEDNPFIDPGYRKYLDGLAGWLRRAWRDGDYSIAAGQFFTTFDPKVHVIEPIKLDPMGHHWWGSLDYGRVHWNMTYLLCQAGERIYVVDEHAARRQLIKHIAGDIKAMLGRNGNPYLHTFVAGQDVFATRHTEMTIAEEYGANGITLSPAKMDRINRASRVMELLGSPNPQDRESKIEPGLFIFDRCKKLIKCLPKMQHDPGRGEDVLKVNANPETGEGGDDPYDALGMGLMERMGRYGYGKNTMQDYRG